MTNTCANRRRRRRRPDSAWQQLSALPKANADTFKSHLKILNVSVSSGEIENQKLMETSFFLNEVKSTIKVVIENVEVLNH